MADYRILTVPTGRNDGRSHILICNKTGEAAVVDTDTNANEILGALRGQGAVCKFILLTHCHFDHVSTSDVLRSATGARVAIHRLDAPGLSDPGINMSGPLRQPPITGRSVDQELEEGDVLRVGDVEITVLHTPGHTPGSCCFLAGEDLFTGDTIFRGAYGNTGFPGGDMNVLRQSAARLLSMEESIAIHPGHGNGSTIGRERSMNPIRA